MATFFPGLSYSDSEKVATWEKFEVEDEGSFPSFPLNLSDDLAFSNQGHFGWTNDLKTLLVSSHPGGRTIFSNKLMWADSVKRFYRDEAPVVFMAGNEDGNFHFIETKATSRTWKGRSRFNRAHLNVNDEEDQRAGNHRIALEKRIERLAELTKASGDPFNVQSAEHLLAFCNQINAERKPAVFPTLNGDLRAVWVNNANEQIAIRFRSDRRKQYVMFRIDDNELIETMGTEMTVRGIEARVSDLGLKELWYHGEG